MGHAGDNGCGEEGIGRTSVPSVQLCCKPETSLKTKYILKNEVSVFPGMQE